MKRLLAALMVLLCGCTSSAAAPQSSETTVSARDILGSITLCGEPLCVPFKEHELPGDFSFGDSINVYSMGEQMYYCPLEYGGEAVSVVYLLDYKGSEDTHSLTACSIGFSGSDRSGFGKMLSIGGINSDSTIDDVITRFGQPKQRSYGSNGMVTLDYSEDNIHISFRGKHREGLDRATVFCR